MNFKKTLIFLSVLSYIFIFTGCSDKSDNTNSNNQNEQINESYVSPLEEFKIYDSEKIQDFSATGFEVDEFGTLILVEDLEEYSTSITVPEGIINFGSLTKVFDENAFSLVEINLPESLKSIGANAFADCSSLLELEIPQGVDFIGENAFSNCYSLEFITIPDSVQSISSNTFQNCMSLMEITLLDGVLKLDNFAFANISSLISINLPETLTEIGNYVFDGCVSLNHLIIPESVHTIGENAFKTVTNFTTIYVHEGSFAQEFMETYEIPYSLAHNFVIDEIEED